MSLNEGHNHLEDLDNSNLLNFLRTIVKVQDKDGNHYDGEMIHKAVDLIIELQRHVDHL